MILQKYGRWMPTKAVIKCSLDGAVEGSVVVDTLSIIPVVDDNLSR
jgi:hypothetical protein